VRKVRLWEYILGTPWLLATIIIVVLLVGALWLWSEFHESNEAEDAKQKERRRSDSIWNDK